MRNHREIPKKFSEKNLLAKPRAILDTTRLREITDLAKYLEFEIIVLKQFPKLADSPIVRENKKSALVTDGLGKIGKDRCKMLYAQNNEEDCKFLFITYLHKNRYKQFEKITFYFRLRSTYLKFYKMLDNFNLQ